MKVEGEADLELLLREGKERREGKKGRKEGKERRRKSEKIKIK